MMLWTFDSFKHAFTETWYRVTLKQNFAHSGALNKKWDPIIDKILWLN